MKENLSLWLFKFEFKRYCFKFLILKFLPNRESSPGLLRNYIKRQSLQEHTIAYSGPKRLNDFLGFVSCYSKEEKSVGFFMFIIRHIYIQGLTCMLIAVVACNIAHNGSIVQYSLKRFTLMPLDCTVVIVLAVSSRISRIVY